MTQILDKELTWTNARITQTFLGYEDHGLFTATLTCTDAGSAQGFGGRALTDPAAAKAFIEGVLAVTKCHCWEQVETRMIRIARESHNGRIVAIRPIIDDWPIFCPTNDLAKHPGLYEPK